MGEFRKLTPAQRYQQAVMLARRCHVREMRDFLGGRSPYFLGLSALERERKAIIREIGRAYAAGLADGRAGR